MTGSYTDQQAPITRERNVWFARRSPRQTYPLLCLAQLNYRLTHIPPARPTLLLISRPPYTRPPPIRIHGKLVRNGPHVRLRAGQEIIDQPAGVEQRPRDGILRPEDLPKGLAGCGVEVGFQGEGFNITNPFGRDHALAGRRLLAGGEDRGVDGYVAGVGEADEGDQGCCAGGVENGEEGMGGVICGKGLDAFAF